MRKREREGGDLFDPNEGAALPPPSQSTIILFYFLSFFPFFGIADRDFKKVLEFVWLKVVF
jgi:hypothetical protein